MQIKRQADFEVHNGGGKTQLTPQTPTPATCGRTLSNNLKPAFQVQASQKKKYQGKCVWGKGNGTGQWPTLCFLGCLLCPTVVKILAMILFSGEFLFMISPPFRLSINTISWVNHNVSIELRTRVKMRGEGFEWHLWILPNKPVLTVGKGRLYDSRSILKIVLGQ